MSRPRPRRPSAPASQTTAISAADTAPPNNDQTGIDGISKAIEVTARTTVMAVISKAKAVTPARIEIQRRATITVASADTRYVAIQ